MGRIFSRRRGRFGRRVVWTASIFAAAVAPGSAQDAPRGGGSVVPCAVPLAWTVGEVDAGFGITGAQARSAAREAADLWEDAVGSRIFAFGGPDASPILFEYDERQAVVGERERRRASLDTSAVTLEARRAGIEDETRRFEALQADYEADAEAHGRAMAEYNADVRRWNREGGAPPEVRARLSARLAELERLERSLRAREAELRRMADELRAAVAELNDDIAGRAREEERFARDFTLVASESGRYEERVTRNAGGVVAVDRRIRVFQFVSEDELVRVLAHELGHALGLGHVLGPGSVMSRVFESDAGGAGPPEISAQDRALLRARCPELVAQPSDSPDPAGR